MAAKFIEVTWLDEPAAPTAPVQDDTANTFDWTYAAGYTDATDYEISTNNGSSYTDVAAKPVNVGNVAITLGHVKVRVKAVPGVNVAGPALSSTAAFTVSGGGVSTSYSNPLGSGDRTASILVVNTGFLANGTVNALINGNLTDSLTWLAATANTSGKILWIDLGASKVIDEAKWHQDLTVSHGTFKFQGSNDNSAWSDVGTSFTLGGSAIQTITALNGNTTAYRYWRIVGVSGTANDTAYARELEFKVEA